MPKPFAHSYIYIEGLEFSYLLIKGGGKTYGGVSKYAGELLAR